MFDDARAFAHVLRRAALVLWAGCVPAQQQTPAPVEYYKLVPGFLRETMNEHGVAGRVLQVRQFQIRQQSSTPIRNVGKLCKSYKNLTFG